MENVIHKEKLEALLKKDGDIVELISMQDQSDLKKMLFTNRSKWSQISMLPEYVYHEFDMKMRRECIVVESKMHDPPSVGPRVIFENKNDKIRIRIDDTPDNRLAGYYRKCVALVAYYVGIGGGKIHPQLVDEEYVFTEEDWILMSIAARYCIMPERFIKKIYLLTQMDGHNKGLAEGRAFYRRFLENMVQQTNVPEEVVILRLHEHSFSDGGLSDVIAKRSVEDIMREYRQFEHYTGELV